MSTLDDFLGKLQAFRSYSREEFLAEPALHDLAERYLQLAIEAVVELCHQLIASRPHAKGAGRTRPPPRCAWAVLAVSSIASP